MGAAHDRRSQPSREVPSRAEGKAKRSVEDGGQGLGAAAAHRADGAAAARRGAGPGESDGAGEAVPGGAERAGLGGARAREREPRRPGRRHLRWASVLSFLRALSSSCGEQAWLYVPLQCALYDCVSHVLQRTLQP